MSSLKMTFSLASLILLIGLVFAPVSVMAHSDAQRDSDGDGTIDVGVHTHPVETAIAVDSTADPAILAVPAHNSHPMPTISLKPDAADATTEKVRDNMVVIGAAPDAQTDGVDANEFVLVIDFDQDVVSALNFRNVAADTGSATALAETEFGGRLLNADDGDIGTGLGTLTINPPTRVMNDDSKWEVVILVGAAGVPNGTADDPLETVRIRISVNAGAVFSFETLPELTVVPGGASQASGVLEITLVNALPMEDDTTAPTASIMASAPDMTTGYVTFTITFSEAVMDVSLGDFEIENGSAEDFGGTGMVRTVVVDPDAGKKVSVGFKATAMVTDTSGNPLDVSMVMPGTYTPEGYVPTVTITAADGTGDDAGKVIFTLNFSETPNPFSVASLSVTGAADPKVTDLAMATMATEGYAATYTLTVTPSSGATEVKLSIAAGVLSSGDSSFFASASGMHTVTPTTTTPDEGGLEEGDTRDEVTKETEYPLSGMLKPGDFVVIAQMNRTDIAGTEIVIAELPNLQRFFAKGGTISLIGGTSDAGKINKSVVITEIMWGLNSSAAIGSQANYQWIELYNTDNINATGTGTATPATVDLSKYKLVFTPTETLPKPANLSDQVSNIELGGWTVDVGSSGALGAATATFSPVNMVSMYRNFKYADLTKVHNKDDATKNRNGQLGVIPSGNNAGGWAASTASDTFAANQLGSPGAEHFVGRAVFNPTDVARNAVVITEVGNNSNDDYDWVELTAIANTNLEKYELQYIEGQNITVLAQFVKKELKAGEILVVLQSNPRNNPAHPIAAGKEWKLGDADRENTGTDSLYHVDSRLKIPNDKGKALFVLRNEKGKKDHNNIVDLAGNSFVTDNSGAYRTNLWPLRATAAGHGNVIDGDVEDFNSGRVYQRNDRGSGIGEKDWSVRGWTGIGYKRSAANNGQNGGTPGFDNGALKEKSSDLASGAAVSISEIMYARGDRNNLPQWIELYNGSATQAVNLNEWKLKIENGGDVDVRAPAVTIANLGGTIIPPNQTVLISAYSTGRVSRGSQGGVDFPRHRVIVLSGKSELEIPEGVNKRNYRLLNETAFKLTLTEKGGGMVDTVGNLGAATAWDLPMLENGEGRSSIIRRYDTGMARDGTMEDGWVFASDSELAQVRVNETYYGSPDDIGTPGYRAGGALPVSLSKFRPERLKDTGEVVVRWITESELNNAGFNILRSEKRDSEFTKVHFEAGQGTTSERTVYEWKDKSAKPNVVYYYQIQDVSLDGDVTPLRITHLRGNVTAAGKATTTWGEIKALQ